MSAARRARIGILDHESARLGGSQHVVARMATCLSEEHHVEIIHGGRGYTLGALAAAFDLHMGQVSERVEPEAMTDFGIPGPRSILQSLATGFRRERALAGRYDLFIYSGHGTPPLCRPGKGMIYCHFPYSKRPALAFRDHPRFLSRRPTSRRVRMALYERIWRRRMRGYPSVLANSAFSARFIQQHWNRDAEVLSPPVAGRAAHGPKRRTIISLGRFIATDRKNLRGQIRALPEFLEQAGDRWTLVMVGFCSEFAEDRAFLRELQAGARGLPVHFMVNAGRGAVRAALEEATLFWHTTGLTNGAEAPPRYQEHFGIATVEAMRAGCVPIVPNAGGQPEIVRHGESGFLCADTRDLVRFSVSVARDEVLRQRLSSAAVKRSYAFAPEVFDRGIRERVERALARRAGDADEESGEAREDHRSSRDRLPRERRLQ